MRGASQKSVTLKLEQYEVLTFLQIYDLKGSTRNRLIQATGRVNEVL